MEEQNFNMVDNILNNGEGEKAQKEEKKKAQDKWTEKLYLKARLTEKKAELSGRVAGKLRDMSDEEFARLGLAETE